MSDSHLNSDAAQVISLPDADLVFYPTFFGQQDSDRYFEQLIQEIHWQHQPIKIYGRNILQPRLTAWYGDAGKSYAYSGIEMQPQPWTAMLLEIKQKVESAPELQLVGVQFNSVLLNLYRDGNDSMGWHSDDEPELGQNPVIASVSFGATRRFDLRHRYDKSLDKISFDLRHGSLLLMQGKTQHFWQHQIPKTRKVTHPRMNLTWRAIVS